MAEQMKALKSFSYAGKRLQRGDEFTARGQLGRPGSDAQILRAIRNAEPVAKVVQSPTYSHRMMQAAPVVLPQPDLPNRKPLEFGTVFNLPAEPVTEVADELDAMDRDALHALAAARGVKVHHLAGAAKVRQALREGAGA